MLQLIKLLTKADATNATVLPKSTYQVPPNVLSRAELMTPWLPSTYDSPHVPGITDPTKSISATARLISTANTEIWLAAFGPKCFAMTSMDKNVAHDTMNPASSASQSTLRSMLLLARRFMMTTVTTNMHTTGAGTLRKSVLNS